MPLGPVIGEVSYSCDSDILVKSDIGDLRLKHVVAQWKLKSDLGGVAEDILRNLNEKEKKMQTFKMLIFR